MSIVTLLTIVIKVQTLCKVEAYPANTIDIINSGHMYASTNGSLVLATTLALVCNQPYFKRN